MSKVLFVLTSHDKLGDTGKKTGFWLEEAASPYYEFIDNGVELVLASPKGGEPPVDPKSSSEEWQTESTRRFSEDEEAQKRFRNTVRLEDVNADDFDAIFIPGGHGPMWDLSQNDKLAELVSAFERDNRIISAVCHGPAGLIKATNKDGSPFVQGRKISAFTNSEERAVELEDVVPFLLESKLRELGADFQGVEDFKPYVVRDKNVVTGQNPASSTKAAREVISLLN
ncbi:MAG: type 1 glutamine amidotransferase domain-containing protein [Thermodesulfobacteriota bacterium]